MTSSCGCSPAWCANRRTRSTEPGGRPGRTCWEGTCSRRCTRLEQGAHRCRPSSWRRRCGWRCMMGSVTERPSSPRRSTCGGDTPWTAMGMTRGSTPRLCAGSGCGCWCTRRSARPLSGLGPPRRPWGGTGLPARRRAAVRRLREDRQTGQRRARMPRRGGACSTRLSPTGGGGDAVRIRQGGAKDRGVSPHGSRDAPGPPDEQRPLRRREGQRHHGRGGAADHGCRCAQGQTRRTARRSCCLRWSAKSGSASCPRGPPGPHLGAARQPIDLYPPERVRLSVRVGPRSTGFSALS